MRWDTFKVAVAGAACWIAMAGTPPALAQGAPRSYEVSPEVYRVLAARGGRRVLMIAWAPGQSDRMHSHGATAGYVLTDCRLRFRFPDGSTVDREQKVGTAFVQDPIEAHAVQNIGDAECRIVMAESE